MSYTGGTKITSAKAVLTILFFFFSLGNLHEQIVPHAYYSLISQGIIGATAFALVLLNSRRIYITRRELVLLGPFILMLFYILISMFYAAEWQRSFVRFLGLILTTALAYVLASKYPLKDLLRLLLVALIAALCLSSMVAVAVPRIGVSSELVKHEGMWNGIYSQKNVLARVAFLSFFVSLFFCLTSRRKRFYALVALFSLGVCVLSGSRTALGMMLIAAVTFFGMLTVAINSETRKISVVTIIFVGAVIAVLLTMTPIELEVHTGTSRDFVRISSAELMLEGRLTLWDFAIKKTVDHNLFFGYGYDGFWGASSDSLLGRSVGLGAFSPADSHNGYVDLFVQFGLFGTVWWIFGMFFYLSTCVFSNLTRPEKLFVVVFFLMFLGYNLTESYVFKSTNIMQFLLSYTIFYSLKSRIAQKPSV